MRMLLGFLAVREQFFGVVLFRCGANHVHCILKITRINREKFVSVLESLVVLLLREIVINVELIRDQGHVALSGASGEFVDQLELLRGITGRIDFRHRAVGVGAGAYRNIFADLLSGEACCGEKNRQHNQRFFKVQSHATSSAPPSRCHKRRGQATICTLLDSRWQGGRILRAS